MLRLAHQFSSRFPHSFVLSTLALAFVSGLGVASPSLGAPAGAPVEARTDAIELERIETEKRAIHILDHLRRQDQILERWARQLSHPKGVGPDAETLRHFTEGLVHFGADVHGLAETRPDLERKHRALVHRAREVAEALSLEKSARIDLAPLVESVTWLEVSDPARLKVASLDQLSQPTCDAAASLGLDEKRAVPSLDASTEVLIRFVPEADGFYRLDSAGSRADTRLALLDGCSGKILRSADDEDSLRARLEFEGTKDEPVWFRVGSDRQDAVFLEAKLLADLVGNASVSGNISIKSSGLPAKNVRVSILSNGVQTRFADSDLAGNYRIEYIDAGTYTLATGFTDSPLLNQAWDGINCGLHSCSPAAGTPIQLADGDTVSEIDFLLVEAATLSGEVVDRSSGQPVSGAYVTVIDSDGNPIETRTTDTLGRYRFPIVEPGAVYLKSDAFGYQEQFYDGVDCDINCEVSAATLINIQADQIYKEFDLSLERMSGIAGRVTKAADGQPVQSGRVTFYDASSLAEEKTAFPNLAGQFFAALDPGIYLAEYSAEGFDPQVFDDINCQGGCDVATGVPITVSVGEVASIDFELLYRAVIEGKVKASDGQVDTRANGSVGLYTDYGAWVQNQYLQMEGDYRFSDLDGGEYHLLALFSGFQSEWYDDEPCVPLNDCDDPLGSGITVPKRTTVSGADFALDRFGSIRGSVTQLDGFTPLAEVMVYAESVEDSYARYTSTNSDGEYVLREVKPGSYAVYTVAEATLDELYNDIPCEAGCDLESGTLVRSDLDSASSGIDFQLERRGWITGSVRDASNGKLLSGAVVGIFDADGSLVRWQTSDSHGEYTIFGLADGSYFVQVYGMFGYVGEIHDGILCPDYQWLVCDPAAGSPVDVAAGDGMTVDLEMEPGGSIHGTIRNTDGDLINAKTNLLDASGSFADSSYGSYFVFHGLPAGSYYVATSSTDEYQDELWPDAPCEGETIPPCEISTGTPVPVALGSVSDGVDFVLKPLPTISGRVVDSDTLQTVPQADIVLINSAGVGVKRAFSPTFRIEGVRPGTYYLQTEDASGYLDQVYGGETCDPGCDPTAGVPIEVDIGISVSGIQIPLVAGPGFRGRVQDGRTGEPLEGVAIDLWRANGEHQRSSTTNSEGFYTLSTNTKYYSETFYLSTYNTDGYTDLVHSGVECPDGSAYQGLCEPTLGTPLVVEPNTHLRTINFVFGDPTIFRGDFESGSFDGWSGVVGD